MCFFLSSGSHEIIHLKFLNENSIISVGQDGNVKLWNLKHAEKWSGENLENMRTYFCYYIMCQGAGG